MEEEGGNSSLEEARHTGQGTNSEKTRECSWDHTAHQSPFYLTSSTKLVKNKEKYKGEKGGRESLKKRDEKE